MLKWSVSSVSTISQQNSEMDSIELSERERLDGEKNGEVDEKKDEVNEGRAIEEEVEAREEDENGGEKEEEAGQLPAFRGRNYLVGGNSHLLSGNQQGRLGMRVLSDKCEASDLPAVALWQINCAISLSYVVLRHLQTFLFEQQNATHKSTGLI